MPDHLGDSLAHGGHLKRFLIHLAEALRLPTERARRIVEVSYILRLDALRGSAPQPAGAG